LAWKERNNKKQHLSIFLLMSFKRTTKYQAPSVNLFAQTFSYPLKQSDLNAKMCYELPD
jgi:hypothetical protein